MSYACRIGGKNLGFEKCLTFAFILYQRGYLIISFLKHCTHSRRDLHITGWKIWWWLTPNLEIIIIPVSLYYFIPADYNTTYDGWLQWRGNQYFIFRHLNAMEEAREFCRRRNSDLVKIDSEAESVFLWKQVRMMCSGFSTHSDCHFCVGDFTACLCWSVDIQRSGGLLDRSDTRPWWNIWVSVVLCFVMNWIQLFAFFFF